MVRLGASRAMLFLELLLSFYWSCYGCSIIDELVNGEVMQVKESFNRGEKIGHTWRMLPAETYNVMKLLLDYSDGSCVFVPIRSMQYMAVIDQEEVIFVDAISARRSIEFAWQQFKPQERSSLTEPVSYRFTYYEPKAIETIKRAQGEFNQCVHQMMLRHKKEVTSGKADVIPFSR